MASEVFKNNIYDPFKEVGWLCVFLAYLFFLVFNSLTSGYFLQEFFTNPSAFVGYHFLTTYLLFSALLVGVVAAGLYAYIEIGRYHQQLKYATERRKLFEVKMTDTSQETLASMEAFLESISYGSGESSWYTVWKKGLLRPMYSFEIVSKGGIVYFFINTREALADAISSAFYAYFPRGQLHETNEYSFEVEYVPDEYSIFAFEWIHSKDNILPIKTYVEFLLDKRRSTLGEQQPGTSVPPQQPLLDPLASLYDTLGSLRGDEQVWIQYVWRVQKYGVVREEFSDDPLKKEYWNPKKLKDEIKDALLGLQTKEKEAEASDEPLLLTPSEERLKASGQRLIEKTAVEVGIRFMYIVPDASFNVARISQLTGVYKLTNTSDNSLIPYGTLLTEVSTVPDLEPPRLDKEAEKLVLLQLYRDRMFWLAPALFSYCSKDIKRNKKLSEPSQKRKTLIMSTEAFATICHFPTRDIQTPTVRRTLATVVEAPDNLPVDLPT